MKYAVKYAVKTDRLGNKKAAFAGLLLLIHEVHEELSFLRVRGIFTPTGGVTEFDT